VGGLSIAFRQKSQQTPNRSKRSKGDCRNRDYYIVTAMRRYHRFLSMAVLANLKQRRKRRSVERGIKDFVRQMRS
jgi:hypothetical protein